MEDDNFISPLDREWYRKVLYSCSLEQDLNQLPDGDSTNVGSRGAMLSGGQKQRIALARAVYARKKLLVLDDVFSALDRETEASIIDRLFGDHGILRDRDTTVVLATNSSRHLEVADRVIIISAEGSIAFDGTYEHLKNAPPSVTSLLPPSVLPTEKRIGEDEMLVKRNKQSLDPMSEKIEDLTRKVGDLSVYRYYIKSIGGARTALFLVVSILAVFCRLFSQLWLKWWADASGGEIGKYMTIYIILSSSFLIFNAACVWSIFIQITPKAAAGLHEILLKTVMSAPQQFFSKTDSGTILNRFSQDMTLIEGSLPTAALITATYFITTLGQLALISTGSGYMALAIPFVLLVIYVLQNIYLRTSRQLRFMDLEAKAPIYTHFTETIEGLSTIRAFGREEEAKLAHLKKLDESQSPYYLLYCIQRWLNLVLDLVVAGLGVVLIGIAVALRSQTSGGLLGVALINILNFNLTLTSLVTYWTQLETSLGAIARLKNFEAQTPREAQLSEQIDPPQDWPEQGAIEFKHVNASYGSGTMALNDLSFEIRPGQKVGICGRSGSGKSSLILALLRLLEIDDSGTITVDGLDLRNVNRETLRNRLITVPQESYLLPGSVRLNADPSSTLFDDIIVKVLKQVHIWDSLASRGGLDSDLKEDTLSQGQLQLFALARAILHHERTSGKILIVDEATSNIDHATDQLMQKVIKEEFTDKGCTVLMIAHRLDSIRDSDVIFVLDGGKIVETGEPGVVLEKET
ncbi:ABC multidrug transporter [Phlyctema vagabunda]|uniref:ABC multidrug transporter n=1 Tax=Phlyctema vagabunda TaxID=108571 RepID=A0ABR4P253_9HELO